MIIKIRMSNKSLVNTQNSYLRSNYCVHQSGTFSLSDMFDCELLMFDLKGRFSEIQFPVFNNNQQPLYFVGSCCLLNATALNGYCL